MSSAAHSVAELLSALFAVHDALDQAEYLLSIKDPDDVREWLIDAVGLDESSMDESLMNEFLTQLVLVREGQRPTIPKPLDKKTPIAPPKKPILDPPTFVVAPLETIPVQPVRVAKPVPSSRRAVREKCFCLAKTELGGHELIGNCMHCGRIICDAEDYGDCLTCGCSKERIHWLDLDRPSTQSASRAIEHKDRLVQYDREGTRRTKIYDDSTDWFAESSDIWKGRAERDEALRKAREFEEEKNKARLGMQVEIDFSTGKISVKDKTEAVRAVEASRDSELDAYISDAKVMNNPSQVEGNCLPQDSEALMELIRDKLGRVKKFQQPTSLLSVLDDL
jgi:hypothetical protein